MSNSLFILIAFMLCVIGPLNGILNQNSNFSAFIQFLDKWKPGADLIVCTQSSDPIDMSILPSSNLQLSVKRFTTNESEVLLNFLKSQFSKTELYELKLIILNMGNAVLDVVQMVAQVTLEATSDRKTLRQGQIPFFFIISQGNTTENFTRSSLQKLSHNPQANSKLFIVTCCRSGADEFVPSLNIFVPFSISEIYAYDKSPLQFSQIPVDSLGLFGRTRSNLLDVTVRATAPEKNLTQGEVVFADNGMYDSGFGVDVLFSLELSLGFRIQVVPTLGWATQYENGSWFGMAQEILEDKADLAVAKTSMLLNRVENLGYMVPTHGLGVYAFFKQPPASASRNIFLGPFTFNMWLLLVAVYVLIVFCILTFGFVQSRKQPLHSDDQVIFEEASIWALGTLCLQGWHSTPKSVSFRMIFTCGMFLGLITYVAYAAALVSMFSVKTIPLKSLSDLIHSKLSIVVDKSNKAAVGLVTKSENATLKQSALADQLMDKVGKNPNSFISLGQDGNRVFDQPTALLGFKDAFYTTLRNSFSNDIYKTKHIQIEKAFCDLSSISVTDIKFRSGLFVAKNSPFKELFNIKMTAMYNSGLMKRYVGNYEKTYEPICDTSTNPTYTISGSDVVFAYGIVACGIATSLLLCAVEYIFAKVRSPGRLEESLEDMQRRPRSSSLLLCSWEPRNAKYFPNCKCQ